ncbi:MAG TPA: thiol:disulfide interchange protein DsbA/DsbL [Lysobacter sp.]
MTRLLRLAALLLLAVPTASMALPPPLAPAQGRDYEVIEGGAPYQPVPGRVEVAEVFGYTCSHCARFEPVLAPWVRTLPAQARFVAIPADFSDSWAPYARAYFAAQALGVAQRTHMAMYEALHAERSLPLNDATPAEIATFYQRHGIAPARFLAAYKAPSVDAQMKRVREFVVRSGIDGTPSLVVAGKYRVTTPSRDGQLRTARWLVDREIAAAKRR